MADPVHLMWLAAGLFVANMLGICAILIYVYN